MKLDKSKWNMLIMNTVLGIDDIDSKYIRVDLVPRLKYVPIFITVKKFLNFF